MLLEYHENNSIQLLTYLAEVCCKSEIHNHENVF